MEGSLAVFIFTTVVCMVVLALYSFLSSEMVLGFSADCTAIVPGFVACIIAGLVATIVEAVCHGAYDNIAIPMSVALVMVLLGL